MPDLLNAANSISSLVFDIKQMAVLKEMLLLSSNKFVVRLGLIASRYLVKKFDIDLVSFLKPHLQDAHPWNRYEAVWGIISIGTWNDDVDSTLNLFLKKFKGSDKDADQKACVLAERFVQSCLERGTMALNIPSNSYTHNGFQFLFPVSIDTSKPDLKYRFAPAKVDDLIQFNEFNKLEITLTVSTLVYDVEEALDVFIKDFFSDASKARVPHLQKIVLQNVNEALYVEYDSYLIGQVCFQKMALIKDTLYFYKAEFPRALESQWGSVLGQWVQSFSPVDK